MLLDQIPLLFSMSVSTTSFVSLSMTFNIHNKCVYIYVFITWYQRNVFIFYEMVISYPFPTKYLMSQAQMLILRSTSTIKSPPYPTLNLDVTEEKLNTLKISPPAQQHPWLTATHCFQWMIKLNCTPMKWSVLSNKIPLSGSQRTNQSVGLLSGPAPKLLFPWRLQRWGEEMDWGGN